MQVDIYARISQDRDGEAVGVETQVSLGREAAERRGWTVRKVHVDNDVSADRYSLPERPAGSDLLADAEDGRVQAVWAVDDDRLWRDEVEQRTVFALLAAAGVRTVVAGGREYDPGDDTDVTPTLLALLGRAENAQKKRRLRRKMRALAEEGKPKGGPRPYGYEDDHVTIRESEAAVLREAAERALDGEPWRTIAADLNDRGVPTARGADWSPSVLREILTRPRIAGLREHKGEVVAEAVWDGIVSEDDWRRLKGKVGSPAHHRGRAPKYLLVGLARCGRDECGRRLQTHYDGDRRVYKCHVSGGADGCGSIQVSGERAEAEVRDRLLAVLAEGGLAEHLRRQRGDDAEDECGAILDELDALDERRAELLEAFDGGGSADMLARASARLNDKEDELRARLADLQDDAQRAVTKLTADELRTRWKGGGVAERRVLLRAFVQDVTVHPATKVGVWDGGRVQVEWRA